MSVLPIVTYDDPVLIKPAGPVQPDYPGLQSLIDNLFETMYNAGGIGLAAPQVGLSLQMFVVDADELTKEEEGVGYGAGVFINPEIEPLDDDFWNAEEGCLSLPDLREQVSRPDRIRIRYYDRDFQLHEEEFKGWYARVLQHEYDHLKGVLFIDYLGSFRKRLIRGKLEEIRKGMVQTEYPISSNIESNNS